jgi:hypothetical protein
VGQHIDLAERLDVDQHASGHGLVQLDVALAWTSEADVLRVGPGVQRHLQFARRGHIDAADQPGHVRHQRRHRVGLHRVMQLDAGRQRRAQRPHTLD